MVSTSLFVSVEGHDLCHMATGVKHVTGAHIVPKNLGNKNKSALNVERLERQTSQTPNCSRPAFPV